MANASINGYYDPSRSPALIKTLEEVHTDKDWEDSSSLWHGTAKTMHAVGMAAIIFGVGIAVGSISIASLLTDPHLSLIVGIVGATGGLTSLVCGIYLMKKDYREDRVHNQQKREKIINHFLLTKDTPQLIRAMDSQPWLIDKQEVEALFIQEYDPFNANVTYLSLANDPKCGLQEVLAKGICLGPIKKKLMREIKDKELTAQGIINIYGWTPFDNGALSCSKTLRAKFISQFLLYRDFRQAYSLLGKKAASYRLIRWIEPQICAFYQQYLLRATLLTEIPRELIQLGNDFPVLHGHDPAIEKIFTDWLALSNAASRKFEDDFNDFWTHRDRKTFDDLREPEEE